MGALDDLLNETEDKEKKKGGLDALLRETSAPKSKGLDALLAETGGQSRPASTPGPVGELPAQFNLSTAAEVYPPNTSLPFPNPRNVFEGIQNQAAESVRADMGTEPRYPSILPAGAPPPSMSLQDMEMFRRAGAETKRQVESGEIPKSQAIAAGIKPFTSVPRMYLMALAPAAAGFGTGLTATATAAVTGGGINIGVETLDRLMAEGRMPTKGEAAIAGTAGAVLGPLAKPVSRAPLGKVIKKISGFFDTSPSQVNKVLGEVAEITGTTRGDVADNIIMNAAQEPEGARYFAEYFRQIDEPPGAPLRRRTAAEKMEFTSPVGAGNAYMRMGKAPRGVQAPPAAQTMADAGTMAPRAGGEVFPPIDPNAAVAKPHMRTEQMHYVPPYAPQQPIIETGFQTPETLAAQYKQQGFMKPDAPGPEELARGYLGEAVPGVAQATQDLGLREFQSGFGLKNRLFTYESYQQASSALKKNAKKLRTGIDPEDIGNLVKVGGYYLEGGIREFAEWSARMVDDFGEGIRPHLKNIYDESLNAIRRVATNERMLPESFNEQAVVSDLTRGPAHRTLKNINISRLDDDGLSNLIDNTVRESPEFHIPNETVAFDVLKERARRFGTGTIDKYLADYNPARGGTPEGDIRQIASEVIAAENVLKNHMETETMNLARQIEAGAGDREAFRAALLTDLRLLRKVGGVSSEFGRALGSRRIKATGEMGMEQRFLREVNKVIGKDGNLDDIAKRMSQIDIFDPTARQIFLRDLVHATTRDKIDEVFYNSILSGIVTQGRNIVGNVGTILMREGERPLAAGIDAARALATGRQRQRYFSESFKTAYGLIEGTREGLNAGWKSFRTEVPQFGLEAGIMSDLPAQRIGGAIRGTKGRIIRISSRALMATDDFFKAVAYRMELNARAYREARKVAAANKWTPEQMLDLYNELRYKPTDALMRSARDEALLRTFQTPAGRIGRTAIQARDNIPGLKYFMPFVRTPLNIMEFGVERMPGVNILSILNRKSQGLPVDWTEEMAKTAMGTMIAAGVYLAHKQGMINGYGPTRGTGDEKAFLSSGRQRYAIKIGDTSISFQNFEPVSTILGVMADTFDAIDAGIPIISEDMALNLGTSLGRNLTEKSFGMGLDTFLSLMTGDYERGAGGLYRTAASFVPFSSLMRGVATGIDPTVRRTLSMEDALKNNTPGLRGDLEPVMDIWGREVVTEAGVIQRMAEAAGVDIGGVGRAVDTMTNIFRIREMSEDPATKEVYRLTQVFPDESFKGLGSPRREIQGIELTREEYVSYVKEAGQLAHSGVTEFINKPFYANMPDEIKKKQIEEIIDNARKQARYEFLRERGVKKTRRGSPSFY